MDMDILLNWFCMFVSVWNSLKLRFEKFNVRFYWCLTPFLQYLVLEFADTCPWISLKSPWIWLFLTCTNPVYQWYHYNHNAKQYENVIRGIVNCTCNCSGKVSTAPHSSNHREWKTRDGPISIPNTRYYRYLQGFEEKYRYWQEISIVSILLSLRYSFHFGHENDNDTKWKSSWKWYQKA